MKQKLFKKRQKGKLLLALLLLVSALFVANQSNVKAVTPDVEFNGFTMPSIGDPISTNIKLTSTSPKLTALTSFDPSDYEFHVYEGDTWTEATGVYEKGETYRIAQVIYFTDNKDMKKMEGYSATIAGETATVESVSYYQVRVSLKFTMPTSETAVTGITINSESGANEVTIGNTLQMKATVAPVDATNKNINWSIENGSGAATIDATGLLTATKEGTINVIATARDSSGIVVKKQINITSKYTFKAGMNAMFKVSTNNDLVFEVPANLADLQKVEVNDKSIAATDYTATGNVKITLKASYLKSLASGEYKLTATFKDGSAKTSFTVENKTSNAPNTGDTSEATKMMFLLVISLFAGCKLLKKQ